MKAADNLCESNRIAVGDSLAQEYQMLYKRSASE